MKKYIVEYTIKGVEDGSFPINSFTIEKALYDAVLYLNYYSHGVKYEIFGINVVDEK